jgi:alpha-D-ribose 1-methylphosphonate 5-triphosphate synthase subunit PhnG
MPKPQTTSEIEARRSMMGALAQVRSTALVEAALAALEPLPIFTDLRPPEVGLVMVRGRIGGDGQPFNLGEATVTRAAVRLESGETGFSYMLGRHPKGARLAALIDALWQRPESRPFVESRVLAPLRERQARVAARQRAETAATKVDFFTVARGEDE